MTLYLSSSAEDNTNFKHYGSTPLMSSDDHQWSGVDNVARRRWHLAYTLMRNPELIQLRKGFVSCTGDATTL